jgi:uncharacterized membrane protein
MKPNLKCRFKTNLDYSVKSKALLDFYLRRMHIFAPPCPSVNSEGEQAPGAGVIGSVIGKHGGAPVVSFRGAETHARSVLKAVSWRTLGTFDTFAISWFLTGRVAIAGSIAAVEIATKLAWYYLHERVWAAIGWGRRHHG